MDLERFLTYAYRIMVQGISEILTVLKQYWGYDSLRDGQLEILESVLSGRDTVAILPTGGGKSLCYQLPALLNQKVTVVVSPLLALMKDQAHHLTMIGIKTVCLNSELKPLDQLRVLNSLTSYQIIYTTPEFLLANQKVITILVASQKLGMLAIDEAHCASSWGHDFRPSYLRLGDMKALLSRVTVTNSNPDPTSSPGVGGKGKGFGSLPGFLALNDADDGVGSFVEAGAAMSQICQNVDRIPILALTATAPPSVIKDIAKILKLENPVTIIGDLGRKNLIIRCMKKTNAKNPALDLHKLIDPSQNTIIYTIKRDETDLIYDTLAALSPTLVKEKKMAKYHADLGTETKHDIYTKFIKGEITVLIATIAFGMGIDKKDIRMIINWGAPSNLETYYQEIGRAGRDGNLSTCYLFWSDADLNLSRFHVTESHQTGALAKESLRKINAMENFLRATECRIGMVIAYLKAEFNMDVQNNYECQKCDNCCITAARAAQAAQVAASQSALPGTSIIPSFTEVDYGHYAFLLFDLMAKLEISYGTTMLVAILRGSENNRMTMKLKKMNSYGKGTDRSEKWWKSFIKFMIGQNYIMKVAKNIQGHLIELLELSHRATNWMAQNAQNNGKLLLREDTELISLGPVKKPTVLSCSLTTSNPSLNLKTSSVPAKKTSLNSSALETVNQIKLGKTIQEIAKARALTNTTIENHFMAGLELDTDLKQYMPQLGLDDNKIEKLVKEMEEYIANNPGIILTQSKLKDVKMIFDSYSYLEIKVALMLKK